MKRSEMAKILETRFDEIGLNITSSVLAESVMRMIEDAGMQPPKIKRTVNLDNRPTDYNRIFSYDEYVDQWDKE